MDDRSGEFLARGGQLSGQHLRRHRQDRGRGVRREERELQSLVRGDPAQVDERLLGLEFFIRNVAEYAKFTRMLADGSRFGYFFDGYSWNPQN